MFPLFRWTDVPADEAVERLIDLIREHDKWVDPPPAVVTDDKIHG